MTLNLVKVAAEPAGGFEVERALVSRLVIDDLQRAVLLDPEPPHDEIMNTHQDVVKRVWFPVSEQQQRKFKGKI